VPDRREMMNRRSNKDSGLRKEKISIIAASVFVLSALTLAGVYMSSGNDIEKEENRIDFAKLEQEDNTSVNDSRFVADNDGVTIEGVDLSENNDMDVDPAFTEANSGSAVNEYSAMTSDEALDTSSLLGTDKAAVFMDETELTFSDGDALVLPIIGEVIMDYNMESAVYHDTMQQYRYNPALVIAADEGATVTAAVDSKVTDIYTDSQTGRTISFDIGGGYELTYGQLKDIKVNVGDMVKAGTIVANVAQPTIYYSNEGTNIYYKLTKNGEPVDPLGR
jgi:murein DD-endopeptidase MepM/ murein hydrolase activator NlpD